MGGSDQWWFWYGIGWKCGQRKKIKSMLFWDVNNGIARRSWARNEEAMFAIKREMERTPKLKVTLPNLVDDHLLNELF